METQFNLDAENHCARELPPHMAQVLRAHVQELMARYPANHSPPYQSECGVKACPIRSEVAQQH